MNKRFTGLLLLLFSTLHFTSGAQAFWTEDFDAVSCTASCGLPYAGVNGSWTQATTGALGDSPNPFYVSCAENGNAAGACGTGCGSDNSLHVGSTILGDMGAAYYSGDGGAGFADGTTHYRAESPTINCTGYSGISIAFNYIENGDLSIDNAQLWYFNGSTWSMLNDLPKTPLCGGGQGQWTAFSMSLPATADGNPNVKIGFTWVNDNDGAGTDPSFAVDDITLITPPTVPVASFTYSPASPCTGDVVTFTSTSTGGGLSYNWTFAGGTPATSTAANPTVTFATAGAHTVTLTVTNLAGTDSNTQTVTVVTCVTPVASFTFSPSPVCAGTATTFTNTSTGGPFTSASWTFAGATPSTSTSTTTATTTWSAAGTYTVTLIVTNATTSDTTTQTITVTSCTTPPTASFTIPAGPFCQGQCITFTNTSSGSPPMSYGWVTTGGTPSTSTSTSPNICYNTPGTYTVTLIANNSVGTDTMSQTITINSCVVSPTASFSMPDTICRGQCLNFTDASTGTPTSWTWSFPGASPGSSTLQNPTSICYNTVGSFSVTLVVSNSSGTSSMTKPIVVKNCSPPATGFTMSDSRICYGDCITFNNVTLYADSYLWLFPGGQPDSSTAQNPGTVCYDSSGAFQVYLIAFNAYGSDTATQNIVVDTVPIIEAFPDQVEITLGTSIDLSAVANGNVTWEWVTTDTASIGDTSLANVTVTPTAPGEVIYYIVATGGNGCSNTDSVIVEVMLTDVIGVPNAFSPNGDGYNDMLKVLGPGISTMHFMVYNRYGQKVFETSDQASGWDGKFEGKTLDPAVFAWYLEYTLVNGYSGVQKGNVTLIR